MAFTRESEHPIGSFTKGKDGRVSVTCGTFNGGKDYIDARQEFLTENGSWQHTSKGLWLSYEQAQLLIGLLKEACDKLTEEPGS